MTLLWFLDISSLTCESCATGSFHLGFVMALNMIMAKLRACEYFLDVIVRQLVLIYCFGKLLR